jgi:hypothetical protein
MTGKIDAEELAICRKRGHQPVSPLGGWTQCRFCNLWVREVRTVTLEEREDEPPANEQSLTVRAR